MDSELEKIRMDMLIYGQAFTKDGVRIDPRNVFIDEVQPIDNPPTAKDE